MLAESSSTSTTIITLFSQSLLEPNAFSGAMGSDTLDQPLPSIFSITPKCMSTQGQTLERAPVKLTILTNQTKTVMAFIE